MTKSTRPNWDEYFLGLLDGISKRATCDRGYSGAVIVSEHNTILTTGYVGSAPGDKHCDEAGHYIVEIIQSDGTSSQHCQRTLHAEEKRDFTGGDGRHSPTWSHALL